MTGNGVVDTSVDAAPAQVLAQGIAVGVSNHVEMKDVSRAGDLRRTDRQTGEHRVVVPRVSQPGGVPLVKARQLEAEHGSLQLIEARIDAHDFVMIAAD